MKDVNKMNLQASNDIGSCYRVAKCSEIVFEKEKMVKGESLQRLNATVKTMDPGENGIYKFLGVEQADGIRWKKCITELKKKLLEE